MICTFGAEKITLDRISYPVWSDYLDAGVPQAALELGLKEKEEEIDPSMFARVAKMCKL